MPSATSKKRKNASNAKPPTTSKKKKTQTKLDAFIGNAATRTIKSPQQKQKELDQQLARELKQAKRDSQRNKLRKKKEREKKESEKERLGLLNINVKSTGKIVVQMQNPPSPITDTRTGKTKKHCYEEPNMDITGCLNGACSSAPIASLEDHHTTFNKAKKMANYLLSRQPNLKSLERRTADLDDVSQARHKRFWKSQKELVDKEAIISIFRRVVALRFRVTRHDRPRREELCGEHCLLIDVTLPDKPNQPETGAPKAVGDPGLQEVEVEEDWVWDNFDKPTIQTAQQVALRHADTFDVICADDDGTEKKTKESGCTLMLNENSNKGMVYENEQVSHVRYAPAQKRKKTTRGKLPPKVSKKRGPEAITVDAGAGLKELQYAEPSAQLLVESLPARWYGLVQVEEGKTKRVVLEETWVNENLDAKLKEFIQNQGSSDPLRRNFVPLPEGDAKETMSLLPHNVSGLPEVKHQQGPGEHACLFKCAASAAHYCGFEQTGARANELSNHNLAPGENWKRLVKAVSSGTSKGHLQPKRLKQSDDVLDVAKTATLVVVGLVSADGSTTHAVALTDKWIFDANLTHALPLSRESLDICCSSDTGHSEFVRLNRGYSFTMR